jgi:predicted Rossmann-fold nucleotide-binding protein
MITLRLLGRHEKPIVVVNVDGFYNHLALFFQVIYREKFAPAEASSSYYLAPDPESSFRFLERYRPGVIPPRW